MIYFHQCNVAAAIGQFAIRGCSCKALDRRVVGSRQQSVEEVHGVHEENTRSSICMWKLKVEGHPSLQDGGFEIASCCDLQPVLPSVPYPMKFKETNI